MLKKFVIGFLVALLLVGPSYATITLTSNSGLTPGTTPVGTSINCILYADGASLLQCDATLVYNNTGSANGVFTFLKNLSGSSATSNFLNITGTLPSSLSAITSGINFNITSAGSSAQRLQAFNATLGAGYTGSSIASAIFGDTSVNDSGVGFGAGGSYGVYGQNSGGGAGTGTGVLGIALSSNLNAYGVVGVGGTVNTLNIGVAGGTSQTATTNIGGFFQIGNTIPTYVSGVLVLDNRATTNDILVGRDNSNTIFQIIDGGLLNFGNNVTTTTTADASRQYVAGDKNLTEASATTFLVVNLPSGSATTVIIEYEIFATDTTDYQIGSGRLRVRYLDKAGTMTCANPTEVEAYASSTTAGTLTSAGFTSTSGSNLCNVQANITSSLVQTILRIKYHAWKLEGTGNLTPQ